MCHVLEHFPFDQVSRILSLLYSKLDRNGLLYLSVPDFSSICNIYLKTNSIETISPQLLGGQDYNFNFHKAIFDKSYLTLFSVQVDFLIFILGILMSSLEL